MKSTTVLVSFTLERWRIIESMKKQRTRNNSDIALPTVIPWLSGKGFTIGLKRISNQEGVNAHEK